MGWGGSDFFLAASQSRLYPHMRAKFGRDLAAASKKVAFKFISRYNNSSSRLMTVTFFLNILCAGNCHGGAVKAFLLDALLNQSN